MKRAMAAMMIIVAIGVFIQTASAAVISVEPSCLNVSSGDVFTVNLNVDPEDSDVFFLSQDGNETYILAEDIYNIDPIGRVEYGESRKKTTIGVKNPGTLAMIDFEVIGNSGVSELGLGDLDGVILSDPDANLILTNVSNGSVEIAQPASPLFIFGHVFYDNGSDCNNPIVTITNLNRGNEWMATTNETSNYYQRMLTSCTDVAAGDVLQFNVTKGSQTVIQTHEVTQPEINAGGLFDFNVTLQTEGHPQVWYFTQAVNTTVGAPYANDGWVHDKDLVMNKTKPAAGTYCVLDGGKALWFYATTGAQTDLSFGEYNWTAKIFTSNPGDKVGNTTTVDVCKITPGGAVTVIASGSVTLISGETVYNITCVDNISTTQNFNTGDWLGVRVSWGGPTSETIWVYYNPTDDKSSYVKSPTADPGYPIPELSTLILFSSGLLALAGYALKTRKSNRKE
jgi:hypothetical protein